MKRAILILGCAVSMFVVSCKKDDPSPGGSANGKVTIENASTNAKNDIVDMINSDGAQSIQALSTLMSRDNVLNLRTATGKKKFEQVVKNKVARFKSIFIPISKLNNNGRVMSDSGRFVYSEHIGIYTWNSTTNGWDVVHSGSIIELRFPSDTNSTVNDCLLQITAYDDMGIMNDWGEMEYYPTSLHAELKISNVRQAKIDYTGNFNNDGVPTLINLELYLNPFTYTINYSTTGETVSATASIAKSNVTIFAVSGTLEFTDNTQTEVKNLQGYTQYRDVKVNAALNIQAFNNVVNPMAEDYNQYFVIDVTTANGSKIGDVVFKDIPDPNFPGSTYVEAYIKFTDGTEELLSDYLQPIIDELENADFGV